MTKVMCSLDQVTVLSAQKSGDDWLIENASIPDADMKRLIQEVVFDYAIVETDEIVYCVKKLPTGKFAYAKLSKTTCDVQSGSFNWFETAAVCVFQLLYR